MLFRSWILDQINQGKLDGAKLLYAGKLADRGKGMHPTALAEVVEQLRSTQSTVQSGQREYTPENITSLKPNEIFVFGSNTEGRHGSGTAKIAMDKFGAKYGQAEGLQGQSYAIVTKDLSKGKRSVSLDSIREQIFYLVDRAKYEDLKNNKIYVTKIGTNLAGFTTAEIKELFRQVDYQEGIPDNIILPKEFEMRDDIAKGVNQSNPLTPPSTSTRSIDYTPKGKEKQTYTIEGARVLDSKGNEAFEPGSIDYNKIFANLAVKEGRAVVVDYRGIKYVVNNKGQIISGSTGKVMQWGERNGDRQAVLTLANQARTQVNAPMSDPNAITDAEIAAIYKEKVDYLAAQNLPVESLESFSARAKRLVDLSKKAGMVKNEILEQVKCL